MIQVGALGMDSTENFNYCLAMEVVGNDKSIYNREARPTKRYDEAMRYRDKVRVAIKEI